MNNIHVQVIYALPQKQKIISVEVVEGATVEAAIIASNLLSQYPALDLQNLQVGIFSQKVPLTHKLKEGDRIEIYRKLLIDPKTARRKRI